MEIASQKINRTGIDMNGLSQTTDPKTYRRLYYREYRKGSNWKEYIKEYNAEKYSRMKLAVFTYYGLNCSRCNETNLENLCIDHINNDGAEHRNKLGKKGAGGNFYFWLIKNGLPDGFQTLCKKCNHQKWVEWKNIQKARKVKPSIYCHFCHRRLVKGKCLCGRKQPVLAHPDALQVEKQPQSQLQEVTP